jgi:hypothetical protein
MSKKYIGLKALGSLLLVVLFILIINSFSRENTVLLSERNRWREKSIYLEDNLRQIQDENRELMRILDQGQAGLIITDLRFEQLTINKTSPHRLSYQITLTVANKADHPIAEGYGELMLAFRLPGNLSWQRTTWRQAPHPAFKAGEVKTIHLSGETPGTVGEEMLLIFSLNQQPGIVKRQILLSVLGID